MRALSYDRYTPPAGLTFGEMDDPEPADDRVLIRVAAASLNPYDWHLFRGEPLFMRLTEGRTVPARRAVGADIAGVVEHVGGNVEGFAIGDRVLGSISTGGLADLASSRPGRLAVLPDAVSMEDGAAIPMAGLTALQALRDTAGLVAGERVLIWGASGGVGHLAVQLARILGALRVDAVCSTRNVEAVRALGADTVIDYTRGESPEGPYDVILDTVSTASVRTLRGLLSDEGRVVTVGALGRGRVLGPATSMGRRMISARFGKVDVRGMLARTNTDDLAWLAAQVEAGSLKPLIERVYPFEESLAAIADLENGRVRGKLVVRVAG